MSFGSEFSFMVGAAWEHPNAATCVCCVCSAYLRSCVMLPPQVGLKHPLEDEDVVQIVLKVR
jgi:hypothetical protein